MTHCTCLCELVIGRSYSVEITPSYTPSSLSPLRTRGKQREAVFRYSSFTRLDCRGDESLHQPHHHQSGHRHLSVRSARNRGPIHKQENSECRFPRLTACSPLCQPRFFCVAASQRLVPLVQPRHRRLTRQKTLPPLPPIFVGRN